MLSLRSFAQLAVIAGLGCASTACSSLTRPDEITIVAEPAPAAEAPDDGHGHAPSGPAPARNAAGTASGG